MKKNISINVGGIIFHIEEEGYEELKAYLTSINRYFSSYEDSVEIIADIESRIAEIFLTKISENKQVITEEDVKNLIATMGSISDFEAAEGLEHEQAKSKGKYAYEHEQAGGKQYWGDHPAKRLFRDERRKLIAGVCAGLAHYFHIDPLWIRMLFLLAFFDLMFTWTLSSVALIAYGLGWIFVPASDELEDDSQMRRLFRDLEDRVLGGVASGLANYFGVNPLVFRLLFIGLIFAGGTGIPIYLIFWVITPVAKTITERMQMKGEPITLENIERKIRESLNMGEDEEENWLLKILLFPFRLIATVLDSLGNGTPPIAKFMMSLVNVLLGIFLVMLAFVFTVALGLLAMAFFGPENLTNQLVQDTPIPMSMIRNSFPAVGVAFSFISIWIPFLFIGILGMSLLAHRMVAKPIVNWGILGFWVIALIGTGVSVPMFLTDFQTEATDKRASVLPVPSGKLVLNAASVEEHFDLSQVRLTVKAHDEPDIRVVQVLESRGRTRENALENASHIRYEYAMSDSILTFGTKFSLNDQMPYRVQKMRVEVYLPKGKEFRLTENMQDVLYRTLSPYGYTVSDLGKENTWVFNQEGALSCLTCANSELDKGEAPRDFPVVKQVEVSSFQQVRISGDFEVHVMQGEEYELQLQSAENAQQDDIKVEQSDNLLSIHSVGGQKSRLVIKAPHLRSLHLSGNTVLTVPLFEARKFELHVDGHSKGRVQIEARELEVFVSGNADYEFVGEARQLEMEVSGKSKIKAADLIAYNVTVKESGDNNLVVNAENELTIYSANAHKVNYVGSPKVVNKKDTFLSPM